jgi:hypothetical protein
MSRNKNRLPFLLLSVLAVAASAYFSHAHSYQSSRKASGSYNAAGSQATSNQAATVAPELANASCHANGVLPDKSCTPGVADPRVTQATIHRTICVSGYTKTVRPSVSYTDKLKSEQMTAYGYTDSIHAHEEDHLISLELGGSPDDPKNLWPEPDASPNPKDSVENYLHTAVCAGRITLQDAQTRIATDWTTAEAGL